MNQKVEMTNNVCVVVPYVEHSINLQYWLDSILQCLVSNSNSVTVLIEFELVYYDSLLPVLKKFNVDVVSLYSQSVPVDVGLGLLSNFEPHYRVYEFLKESDFDNVISFDRKGLLFYSCIAKNMGLEFKHTSFTVVAVDPLLLSLLSSNNLIEGVYYIGLGYMERRVAELSCRLICSDEIYDWMKIGGYDLRNNREPISTISENHKVVTVDNIDFEQDIELNIILHSIPDHIFKVIGLSLKRYPNAFKQYSKVNIISENKKTLKHFTTGVASESQMQIELLNVDSIGELKQMLKSSSINIVFENKGINIGIISLLKDLGLFYTVHCCAKIGDCLAVNHFENQNFHPKVFSDLISFNPQSSIKVAKRTQNTNAIFYNNITGDVQPQSSINKINNEPKVSIIVVHHERPNYLARMLSSIERQDYSNIEVIVIDDGSQSKISQNGFDQLQQKYKIKEHWLFVKSDNQWLGSARNIAASYATSDYLIFVDDDNILKPQFASTYMNSLLNSKSDILTCFTHSFLENEFAEYKNYSPPVRSVILPIGGCLSLGIFENCYGDASCIVKKTVFDKLGGFWEYYGLPKEDHDFFTRAATLGYKIEVVPEALYYYRLSDNGMMSSNSNNGNFDLSANLISSIESSSGDRFNQSLSIYEKQAQNLVAASLWVMKGRRYSKIPKVIISCYKLLKVIRRKLNYLFKG